MSTQISVFIGKVSDPDHSQPDFLTIIHQS